MKNLTFLAVLCLTLAVVLTTHVGDRKDGARDEQVRESKVGSKEGSRRETGEVGIECGRDGNGQGNCNSESGGEENEDGQGSRKGIGNGNDHGKSGAASKVEGIEFGQGGNDAKRIGNDKGKGDKSDIRQDSGSSIDGISQGVNGKRNRKVKTIDGETANVQGVGDSRQRRAATKGRGKRKRKGKGGEGHQ